jgi:signal transduction histidine kinase
MDELIDDVLSLARHGERVVETEPVALSDAAERAWAAAGGPDDSAARLRLRDPPTVRGDESRVVQLFEKLFGNAADHAGPGPTVTVGRLPDEDGFYVADDGPGIPPDRREDVFERGFSTEENGTGFGLGIVAEIVDAHDWTVRVTDAADGGARFEILAPTVEPFDG